MDEAGIEMQVLSLTAPGIQLYHDGATAIRIAKQANELLSRAIEKYPTRFAGFAALPTQDPQAAAEELERAVQQLGLKGALINGQTNGEYLDDKKYWMIFERAEALGVPIYLHPALPSTPEMLKPYEGRPELIGALWSFTADTGMHALRLIFSGVFDAYPSCTLILGHLGETLPFLLWRFDKRYELDTADKRLKKQPSAYIQENIVVATSGMFSYPPFLCTLLALGADRIVFAVDYPYESNKEGADFIETAPISETDRAKICHLNIERLLKL